MAWNFRVSSTSINFHPHDNLMELLGQLLLPFLQLKKLRCQGWVTYIEGSGTETWTTSSSTSSRIFLFCHAAAPSGLSLQFNSCWTCLKPALQSLTGALPSSIRDFSRGGSIYTTNMGKCATPGGFTSHLPLKNVLLKFTNTPLVKTKFIYICWCS